MATVDELFEQAMKLTEAEREELANRLYQSFLPAMPGSDDSPEEHEAAWAEEIERRLEMVERGEGIESTDWRTMIVEMREELRRRRGS